MKKVFLALLCAGLFFACGNKKDQTNNLVDSTANATVETMATDSTIDEQQPAAEPEVAEATPAKKTNTTPAKKTNNSGMTSSKTNASPTVEEHAKSSANKVANAAIDKAEKEATTTIVNSGKQKR